MLKSEIPYEDGEYVLFCNRSACAPDPGDAGDFLCIYVVVPETGRYREFSSSEKYGLFGQAREGMDFFAATREAAGSFSHPDDLNRFLSVFTRENVMAEIGQYGIFTVSYRLMLEGKPTYVQLRRRHTQKISPRRGSRPISTP